MFYTTYFAMLKRLPVDIVPISISAKPPAGYAGLQYKKLAPSYDILMEWKRTHDNEHYVERFNEEVLGKLSCYQVLKEISELVPTGTKSVALVCFEKSGDFCHRHLVADWMTKNGIECNEYVYDLEKAEHKPHDESYQYYLE